MVKRKVLIAWLALVVFMVVAGAVLWFLHAKDNQQDVTQTIKIQDVTEPIAADGNPVLFDGDSPTRQQYLQGLEQRVVAKPDSNVATIGVITKIADKTLTIQKVEPNLTPTTGKAIASAVAPTIGTVDGTLQISVNEHTKYDDTSFAALHTGQVIAAGGTDQNGNLHAEFIGAVATTTARMNATPQTVGADVPSNVPVRPTAKLADIFTLPPTPQQELDDAQSSVFMTGSSNKNDKQFNYSGSFELMAVGKQCSIKIEPQLIADNHLQWDWPFDVSAPDRQHLQATAVGRSDGAVALDSLPPQLSDSISLNQTNRYSFYSGFGGAIGTGISLGCAGSNKKYDVDKFQQSFAMVNATYNKAALSGDHQLDIPQLSCMGWSFNLREEAIGWGPFKIPSELGLKICLDESVGPAPLKATAKAGSATQALSFSTGPTQLASGFANVTSVRLSNFTYSPTLNVTMHVTVKPPSIPSVDYTTATGQRLLPSQSSKPYIDVTLIPTSLSLRGGATVDFEHPIVQACTLEGGVLVVGMSAMYNDHSYGLFFEGPAVGQATNGHFPIVVVGPASKSGIALAVEIDPSHRPRRSSSSSMTNSWDIVSSGNGGSLDTKPIGSGVSGSFKTDVAILNDLPGVKVDSSKPITASGSWFCPGTHYNIQ